MDEQEYRFAYKNIEEDARAIIHNQHILENINSALANNLLFPFEQDIIYADHYGLKPSEPQIFEVNGVKIKSRVLHQTGIRLSDIGGADLLYEIAGEKFILIQYKRANESGHVPQDLDQLEKLLSNCPDICYQSKKRPIPITHLPLRLNPFCGCWYSIVFGEDQNYVHACEAEAVFQSKNIDAQSFFRSGISRSTFLELFASCRTGALLKNHSQENLLSRVLDHLVDSHHIIFHLIQEGLEHLFR